MTKMNFVGVKWFLLPLLLPLPNITHYEKAPHLQQNKNATDNESR